MAVSLGPKRSSATPAMTAPKSSKPAARGNKVATFLSCAGHAEKPSTSLEVPGSQNHEYLPPFRSINEYCCHPAYRHEVKVTASPKATTRHHLKEINHVLNCAGVKCVHLLSSRLPMVQQTVDPAQLHAGGLICQRPELRPHV